MWTNHFPQGKMSDKTHLGYLPKSWLYNRIGAQFCTRFVECFKPIITYARHTTVPA